SVVPSFETARDGRDYIEGGGGSDVVFAGLGQDDVIGGSSNLFGLTDPSQRPDGGDILFGGAGTRTARNYLGQGGDSTSGQVAEHARDADVILGDNGAIYRLVSAAGPFLTFAYDRTADVGNNPTAPFTSHPRGSEFVIPRSFLLLDYTPGNDAAGIGGSDLIKAEDGDDIVHGMRGNDVLYGDGWDDDLYGGTGSDKLFGGSGEDGLVADDGLIKTSRNGVAEPLHGLAASAVNVTIALPGPFTGAVVDLAGFLKKTVDLTVGAGQSVWDSGGNDIVYGGLGDDFIHGGSGNDALSGAEALPQFYADTRVITVAPLVYNTTTRILESYYDPFTGTFRELYDPLDPRSKIAGFLLNFESFDAAGRVIHDGKDWIYGDKGHDVLFGGTGHDRLFGGLGDDYHQLDDNLDTNGGLNTDTDDQFDPASAAGGGDFAYGGGGLDVLIANSGGDRMFDWTGEFNSFLVPFARFGLPTVVRSPSPHVLAFVQALGAAGGADPNLTGPNGEIGLVTQQDPEWGDNHGGPRDPQPGNGHGAYDGTGGPEDDRTSQPLQTAHGSTPIGNGAGVAPEPGVRVEKSLHAPALGIGPAGSDIAPGISLPVGTVVFWTYEVWTETGDALVIQTLRDDAGTPGNLADDFTPVFLGGDTDGDGRLDLGELWRYTSVGVANYQVIAGQFVNRVVVTAQGTGSPVTDSDRSYHFGGLLPPPPAGGIDVEKAVNAANPLQPTTAEDADDPNNPRTLPIGTSVVWTYLVRNTGQTGLTNVVLVDDAGTPGVPGDDFFPVLVSGDANADGVLDPTETWLYTSQGRATYTATSDLFSNVATATANRSGSTVTDSDVAALVGVVLPPPPPAGISIEKAVNAADPLQPTVAEDADDLLSPRQLPIDTPVVWTYVVRNTNGVALSNVVVVDDAGTPGNPADDFFPRRVSGDADADGLLDPTEVWLYTSQGVATYLVTANLYSNVGSVTAAGPGGTITDSDAAHLVGTVPPPPVGGVRIKKAVNAANPLQPTATEDANDPNNPRTLAVGTTVVWTYLVTNTGTVPLTVTSLIDDNGTAATADDFNPQRVSGDSNANNLLDPGEVWLFTSAGVVSQTVVAGLYGNFATVTAVGSAGTATARDAAYYVGATPGLVIRKAMNAVNPDAPTPEEEADAAPGRTFPVGTPIIWTYRVMNTDVDSIEVISIVDDAGTPADPTDDFTPVYVHGDSNGNNLLDPGEVWLYTSAGVASVPAGPIDWQRAFRDVLGATDTSGAGRTPGFVFDPVNTHSDTIFTGGQTKDTQGIDDWKWKVHSPQDKDDIAHAFGASYAEPGTGHTLLLGGLDRFAANGNSTIGFWFFQHSVGLYPDRTFSGAHTDGDLLLVVNFEVGGSAPTVALYRWTGTDATGTLTPLTAPAGSIFAFVNSGPLSVPWSFRDKFGYTSPQAGEYILAGVDVNALFGPNAPRYVGFLAETRSSTSVESTLSDFALGTLINVRTNYVVVPGPYVNIATVVGVGRETGLTASDTDVSHHVGVGAGVLVETAVNAANPAAPTPAEDADLAPGRLLQPGAPVTWTYLVTNRGNTPLTVTSLVDDAGTPATAGDDFAPVPVLSAGFNVGDTDRDNLLDVGEAWLYTSAGVRAHTVTEGLYTGRARVVAVVPSSGQSVADQDAANHFGEVVGIDVQKDVLAVDPYQPTSIEEADAAPGPALVSGTTVVWTYRVINTAGAPLTITGIVDNFGTPSNPWDDFTPAPVLSAGFNIGDIDRDNLLDHGEMWLYTSLWVRSYKVVAGQYASMVTLTSRFATTNQTATVTDFDYHYGQKRGEGNTPAFWKTNADSGNAVAWPRESNGDLVYLPTWTLESVFDVPDGLGLDDTTLTDALGFTGGAHFALLQQAVAALLNATHPRIAYQLTARQVIDQVNAVLAGGNAAHIANLRSTLNGYNSLGSDLDQNGNTSGPLQAAALPVGSLAGAVPLTPEALAPIVAAAVARWQAAGAPASVADIPVVIADLSDGQLPVLGYARDGVIVIDATAGGFGWFIDPTPADDAEFAAGSLVAPTGSPAAGRMDLLSVVMHELGHVLGLGDVDGEDHELMGETLAPGVRRVPGHAAPLDAPAAGQTRSARNVPPSPVSRLATVADGLEPGWVATVIPTPVVKVEALPEATDPMPVTARLAPETVADEGWEQFMGAAVDWFDDRPTLA
ncbi:MAG TPA: hypothetical protein VM597_33430, partial [Gemmataceae bacterium]|nr:hypothetical protein [Gemmataceae bacterium]